MDGVGVRQVVRRTLEPILGGIATAVIHDQQREASSRRFHWSAVTNPRISVWSIVEMLRSAFPLSSVLPGRAH